MRLQVWPPVRASGENRDRSRDGSMSYRRDSLDTDLRYRPTHADVPGSEAAKPKRKRQNGVANRMMIADAEMTSLR